MFLSESLPFESLAGCPLHRPQAPTLGPDCTPHLSGPPVSFCGLPLVWSERMLLTQDSAFKDDFAPSSSIAPLLSSPSFCAVTPAGPNS